MTDPIRHRFAAGTATAVLGAGGAALIDASPEDAIVALFDEHLVRGAGFTPLVPALLQLGLENLPAFVAVATVADGFRLLVRGNFVAEVLDGEGISTHYSAVNVSVWREEPLRSMIEARLSTSQEASPTFFSTVSGVVPAGAAVWFPYGELQGEPFRLDEPVGVDTPDVPEYQHPGPLDVKTRSPAITAPPAPTTESPIYRGGADEFAFPGKASQTPHDPERSGVSAFDSGRSSGQNDDGSRDGGIELSQATPGDSMVESPECYVSDQESGDLLHETQYRRPDDAADGLGGLQYGSAQPTEIDPDPSESDTLIDEGPSSGQVNDTMVLIDAPSASVDGSLTEIRPVVDDPDHDGRTEIRRPGHGTASSPLAVPTGAPSGPTVHAISCPANHPNPVTQGRCRQCDSEIVERVSTTIPRPPLGLLRFSTNQVVDMDGPVVVGRMPPDDPIDGERPEVVAVDNSELSRFHALVTADDWFVYVADQGSTNGTSVIVPGREPVTCRAYERMQVPPGSVVNLGGVLTFRFDVI